KAERSLAPLLEAGDGVTARRYACLLYWGRAQTLDRLDRHADAARDWERARDLDDGPDRAYFDCRRLLALRTPQMVSQAIARANELAAAKDVDPSRLFELGRVFALASTAREDAKLREQDAARAVELLRQALDRGLRARSE